MFMGTASNAYAAATCKKHYTTATAYVLTTSMCFSTTISVFLQKYRRLSSVGVCWCRQLHETRYYVHDVLPDMIDSHKDVLLLPDYPIIFNASKPVEQHSGARSCWSSLPLDIWARTFIAPFFCLQIAAGRQRHGGCW